MMGNKDNELKSKINDMANEVLFSIGKVAGLAVKRVKAGFDEGMKEKKDKKNS